MPTIRKPKEMDAKAATKDNAIVVTCATGNPSVEEAAAIEAARASGKTVIVKRWCNG